MTKVILGNHSAVFTPRSEQDRIRKVYGDVLDCKVRVKSDEVDGFQLDNFHFCFIWQTTAVGTSDFLKAMYLELKTDNTEEMKQKNLAFAVKKLDVQPLFPGSRWEVFRLVGIDEDLSLYEESPSSKPGSSASAS